VIGWLLENMIWASAAMLVVLAVRRPVAALLGAGAAYALWLVPAVRLLAPPGSWFAPFESPLAPLVIEIDGASGGTVLPADAGTAPWVLTILAIWAAGAGLFLIYQAGAYRMFLRRLSLSLQSAGSFGRVPIMTSAAVDGPVALGLLDRRIVVPADFEARYSEAERALALAHEAYHHRRLDILANHFALVVLALNWFNPIAWFAFRAFRADQELSCDAAVAAAADPQARCDYARALVKSASRPGLIAACPLNHADQLKRRLQMLNDHRKSPRRALAGAGVTAILVATSLAFGAPVQAQETSDPKQERTIIIREHRNPARSGGQTSTEHRDVIRRNLSPEMAERVQNCRDGNSLVNVDEGEGNQRTRFMLCTRGEGGAQNSVQALQRARERIAGEDNLSAEAKQRILTQIDQAIARARRN
jgi:bla regulator protein blaR1